MTSVRLRLLGTPVTVRGDRSEDLTEPLVDLLDHEDGPCSSELRTVWRDDDDWEVHGADGTILCRSPIQEDLAGGVVHALTKLALDQDDQRLHVHAAMAVVGGVGVMLCGESGSGKSTLTAELVRRGHSYLTDEMVALHSTARSAQGLGKPIGLKGWAAARYTSRARPDGGRVNVAASRLGPCSPATQPGLVVFPRFDEGSPTAPLPVAAPDAVLRLGSQLFDGARFGPVALDAIVNVVAHSSCWLLDYSDVAEAADAIEALVPTPSPQHRWSAAWNVVSGDRHVTVDDTEMVVDAAVTAVRVASTDRPETEDRGGRVPVPDLGPLTALLAGRDRGPTTDRFVVVGGLVDALDGAQRPRATRPTWLLDRITTDHVGPATDGHPLATLVPRGRLFAASGPVSVGARTFPTLHPRHRFLDLAMELADDPTEDLAHKLVTSAQLPASALTAVIGEADRWGVLDQAVAGILVAAAEVPGLPPQLRRTVDRLSAGRILGR